MQLFTISLHIMFDKYIKLYHLTMNFSGPTGARYVYTNMSYKNILSAYFLAFFHVLCIYFQQLHY